MYNTVIKEKQRQIENLSNSWFLIPTLGYHDSQIVNDSPYLTMDVLESCFPYALLRNAYHEVYKVSSMST